MPRYICLLLLIGLSTLLCACSSEDESASSEAPATTSEDESGEKEIPKERRLIVVNEDDEEILGLIHAKDHEGLGVFHSNGENFRPLPTSVSEIQVAAKGYLGRVIHLEDGENTSIQLLKLSRALLSVTTPDGTPLPNVSVEIKRVVPNADAVVEFIDDEHFASLKEIKTEVLQTNRDGEIILEGLIPAANYTFTTTQAGFAKDSSLSLNKPKASKEHRLEMQSEADTWVFGHARSEDSTPLLNAQALFYSMEAGKNKRSEGTIPQNGRFALPLHAAETGVFSIRSKDPELRSEYSLQQSLSLDPATVIDLGQVTLLKLWVIAGQIMGVNDEPKSKAYIKILELPGVHLNLDSEGAFVFQGQKKSKIFGHDGKFTLMVFANGEVSNHDITKAVKTGKAIEIDLTSADRLESHFQFMNTEKAVRWTVYSTAIPNTKMAEGVGDEPLRLFAGTYEVWARGTDGSVGVLRFSLKPTSGEQPTIGVLMKEAITITPVYEGKVAAGGMLPTAVLLNHNQRALMIPPITLHRGEEGTAGLRTNWVVPKGLYKVRLSYAGRTLTEDAGFADSEGKETVVFK